MAEINTTDVFVTKGMARDGSTKATPVRLSEVAIASIAEFGFEMWKDYNETTMMNFAKGYNWSLNLWDDDDDFEALWTKFCDTMNGAITTIETACRDVDFHTF